MASTKTTTIFSSRPPTPWVHAQFKYRHLQFTITQSPKPVHDAAVKPNRCYNRTRASSSASLPSLYRRSCLTTAAKQSTAGVDVHSTASCSQKGASPLLCNTDHDTAAQPSLMPRHDLPSPPVPVL
ncbi:hypothetical protein M0R45_031016 [Rubus argutus]|uniref:Uncharacterized protein n=1 Tax=Rubus argutus TaxID=59490 RepID=A0AAW1WEX6_RUBAR